MSAHLSRRLATLLAVLACLVLPVGVVSTWLHLQVVDAGAYVSAVGPLSGDPVVQDAVATDIEQVIRDAVPLGGGELGGAALDDAVRPAVLQVVRSSTFADAWEAGNRTAHRQVIAVLADDGSSAVSSSGRIRIDLDLVRPVADAVGAGGLIPEGAISDVGFQVDLVSADDLARGRRAYAVVDALGVWPATLWAVLAAVALVLPGSRRRVLTVLGVGSVVTLGLLTVALLIARSVALDQASGANAGLAHAYLDALLRSLWVAVGALGAAAVVVLVLTAVGGLLTRPRRPSP